MDFDFETVYDRHNHDAKAVDGLGSFPGYAPDRPGEGVLPLPMWIADMSFATFPGVKEALERRAAYPLYGYFDPPAAYYQAILDWQIQRHGFQKLTRDHIGYLNSVLAGVSAAVRAFTQRGEGVLVHEPVYAGFTRCLDQIGRRPVFSPLRKQEGRLVMDLDHMERILRQEKIHLALLSNPHNPSGRAWTREELAQAMALFKKWGVYVLSDEIWSDLVLPGYQHTPAALVSEDARERTISFYAPSKTFNLAGLQAAYSIVFNPSLRDRLEKVLAESFANKLNVLSMHALMGAYCPSGGAWLDALRRVLAENIRLMVEYLGQVGHLRWFDPQATYLLFIDLSDYLALHHLRLEDLEARFWQAGVMVQDGRQFRGQSSIRMNLALPKSQVLEAIRRMKEAVFTD